MEKPAKQRWRPFMTNPVVSRRNAKLHKLKRAGLTGHETKEQMRQLGEQAMSGTMPTQRKSCDGE